MKKRKQKARTKRKNINKKTNPVCTNVARIDDYAQREDALNAEVGTSDITVKKKIAIPLAFLAYLAVSVGLFGVPLMRQFGNTYVGIGPDPFADMWGLYWWPYAVAHGLNPFITHAIWAPDGFNLTWTNLVPGAGLLATPITLTLGPVVAHNVLYILAPALAALTACILIYHITRSMWPSLIAGYLFGFSSYEIGQLMGHLCLILIFLIPLGVYLVLLRIEGRIKPVVFILLVTIVLTFQFLFSVELFATMTIFGSGVLGLGLIILKKDRREIISAALETIYGYILTAVAVGPYLYYMLSIDYQKASINPPTVFSVDPLNFLLPTPVTFIGHGLFEAITAKFTGRNWAEDGAYIGLPLLLILLSYALGHRRSRTCKLLLASLLLIGIAALGPTLHVMGKHIISLPWTIFTHVPLLKDALPERFMVYAFLIIAICVGIWLSDRKIDKRLKVTLISLSVIFLLPNLPSGMWRSNITLPPFISQGLYKKYITRGENVLIIPYDHNGASTLWQADAGMYFNQAGGYVGFPSPAFMKWPIITTFFSGSLGENYPAQLEYFLGGHDVGAVILGHPSPKVFSQLFASLGVTPINTGGVTIYDVPEAILSKYHDMTSTDATAQADLDQFSALYTAAGRFLAADGSKSDLYPLSLENKGYLSAYYGGYPANGPRNWTLKQGWAGARSDGIGIGVIGSGAEIVPIINKYGKRAMQVYFPGPAKLTSLPAKNTNGPLLMVFSEQQLISDARNRK